MVSGFSTVEEHTPLNQEVWIRIPPGAGLFLLLLSFPHQWSVLNLGPQEGASLTVCCESYKSDS